jgi:hypothetical protein
MSTPLTLGHSEQSSIADRDPILFAITRERIPHARGEPDSDHGYAAVANSP